MSSLNLLTPVLFDSCQLAGRGIVGHHNVGRYAPQLGSKRQRGSMVAGAAAHEQVERRRGQEVVSCQGAPVWHMCAGPAGCVYLCVTTPLAACSSDSCCTELKAPRNLNAPLQAAPNRQRVSAGPSDRHSQICATTLLTLFEMFRT